MKRALTADPINMSCVKPDCYAQMEFCVDNGYDRVEELVGKLVVSAYNVMLCHSCKAEYEISVVVSTRI